MMHTTLSTHNTFRHLPSAAALRQSIPFIFLFFLIVSGLNAQKASKPNVIYILADDLGYGDLSCYGQKKFATPHIDQLAREGVRFTQHYSGSPVCAPSRSALMTGLHTGHTFVRGNKEVQPEGQWPLPEEAYTLTEMAQHAGYVTGAFGKWGLGFPGSEGGPHRQGVSEFFGYNCQRLAHTYYPEYLWHDQLKVELKGNRGTARSDYAPLLIHEQVLSFLEANQDTSFFLYYPMVIPHAELAAPEKYMAHYRGKFLPEKRFEGTDAGEENYRRGPYASQPEAHAAFAAMVHLMDEQVGSVMRKVAELGLDENTIIIFSSDNGPHLEGGADPDYFNSNGILRGYKRDLYEGGIRVPMIARWKGHIKAGAVSDHVSAFWDVMPTFAELAGVNITHRIDGISFLPTLLGEAARQKQHDYLYWEFHELGGRMALRQGDWKLVQYDAGKVPAGEMELYNLKEDPSEKTNLADQFPERVRSLGRIMYGARVPSKIFSFPLDNP